MKPLFLLLAALLAAAQSVEQRKVDAAVEASMKAWDAPGVAVVLLRGDTVLLAKGYGVRNRETGQPVTADTQFAIGSTTKAFVTAALAMLADDGKLSFDDPVRQHLPYFRLSDPSADRLVTLRDLVTHRTGLVRHDLLWYASPWDRDEIVRRAGSLPLTYPFRSRWSYQNIMFIAAGQAVGRAAGSSWEEFTRARIFAPLRMRNSNFSVRAAAAAPDHATPHVRRDSGPQAGKVEAIPWRNLDNAGPAGSINSSVNDLANWLRLFLNQGVFEGKRLISAKSFQELVTPQMVMPQGPEAGRFYVPGTQQISYALGWAVHDYKGRHMVTHGGAIDGFRAQIAFLPAEKAAVAVLSNLGDRNLPEALRLTLLDLLLDLPAGGWDKVYLDLEAAQNKAAETARAARERAKPAGTRPSHDLPDFAGEYREAAYGTLRVLHEDGKLIAAWSSFREPLHHDNFDTFRIRGGRLDGSALTFRLSDTGAVESVRFLDMDFTKVSK
jgi:CubicO group peptidase (beta-lactamase class C family)